MNPPRNPAKAFLKRYRALIVRYDSMTREIRRLRESLTGTTVQLKADVVTGSGAADRMAATMARIIDLETAQADEIAEIRDAMREVLDAIHAVQDEMQKAVLTLRYVEGLDWISLAERINYSEARAYVIHGRALEEINEWLKRREERIV